MKIIKCEIGYSSRPDEMEQYFNKVLGFTEFEYGKILYIELVNELYITKYFNTKNIYDITITDISETCITMYIITTTQDRQFISDNTLIIPMTNIKAIHTFDIGQLQQDFLNDNIQDGPKN